LPRNKSRFLTRASRAFGMTSSLMVCHYNCEKPDNRA
jgi:hypothetical protein